MIRWGVVLGVLALAACAATSVPWVHSSLPESQWAKDWRACKRQAEMQTGVGEIDESSPFRDFDRQAAKRKVDSYTSYCMTDLGYVPARPRR